MFRMIGTLKIVGGLVAVFVAALLAGHSASASSALMIDAHVLGGGSGGGPVGCLPVNAPSNVDLFPFNPTCDPNCDTDLEIDNISVADASLYHESCLVYDSTGFCTWQIFHARFTLIGCDNEVLEVDGTAWGLDSSGNQITQMQIVDGVATSDCLFAGQWTSIKKWTFDPDGSHCDVKAIEFDVGCCACPNGNPAEPQC